MTSFVIIKNQKSISAMNKLVLKDQLKFYFKLIDNLQIKLVFNAHLCQKNKQLNLLV
jgi:hypothetical protein